LDGPRAAGVGLRLLRRRGVVAAAPGNRLPGRGPSRVALRGVRRRPAALRAAAAGAAGLRPLGAADAAAVRRRHLDRVPAHGKAWRRGDGPMRERLRFAIRPRAVALGLLLALAGGARGDGGVVRLAERVGGYRVTVFTEPTPLRAGPID